MYLIAATFPTFDHARAARRSVMERLAILTFDAQLDGGHGDAMVVFRVRPSDVLACRGEIAYDGGTVVYERALGARRLM
jgi:hypothetical protein